MPAAVSNESKTDQNCCVIAAGPMLLGHIVHPCIPENKLNTVVHEMKIQWPWVFGLLRLLRIQRSKYGRNGVFLLSGLCVLDSPKPRRCLHRPSTKRRSLEPKGPTLRLAPTASSARRWSALEAATGARSLRRFLSSGRDKTFAETAWLRSVSVNRTRSWGR